MWTRPTAGRTGRLETGRPRAGPWWCPECRSTGLSRSEKSRMGVPEAAEAEGGYKSSAANFRVIVKRGDEEGVHAGRHRAGY